MIKAQILNTISCGSQREMAWSARELTSAESITTVMKQCNIHD